MDNRTIIYFRTGSPLYKAFQADNWYGPDGVFSLTTKLLAVRADQHQDDDLNGRHNSSFTAWLEAKLRANPHLKLRDIIRPLAIIFNCKDESRPMFYQDGCLTLEQVHLWAWRAAADCAPRRPWTRLHVAAAPRSSIHGPLQRLAHQRRRSCETSKPCVDCGRHAPPPEKGHRPGDGRRGLLSRHPGGEGEEEGHVRAGAAPARNTNACRPERSTFSEPRPRRSPAAARMDIGTRSPGALPRGRRRARVGTTRAPQTRLTCTSRRRPR